MRLLTEQELMRRDLYITDKIEIRCKDFCTHSVLGRNMHQYIEKYGCLCVRRHSVCVVGAFGVFMANAIETKVSQP